MTRPNITVHIEELVLHGIDPADRHAVADAMHAELERLLRARGLGAPPAGPLDVPALRAGAVHLPANAPARAVGTRVARALHGVLAR